MDARTARLVKVFTTLKLWRCPDGNTEYIKGRCINESFIASILTQSTTFYIPNLLALLTSVQKVDWTHKKVYLTKGT